MPRAPNWTRTRTLRRGPSYRPIENEDVKYMWAAYKRGAFKEMGFSDDLGARQFKEAFERLVVDSCHAAWTLFDKDKRPVGIVLAAWVPSGAYLVVLDISWLPWASKRNIIECTIAFFDGVRREFPLMGYARLEHKRMYEVAMMHGVIRRVGTSHIVIPGQHTAVFETRKP